MEEFLRSWSYLGIFLGIIATGAGFPMPEELPIVIGGALSGGGTTYWWIMLPVCIVSVVMGDGLLYFIGWRWGRKLLQKKWVQRWLPPERVAKVAKAFHENGIRILLVARVTPGIRMPIFFTAGLTHLPLRRFLIADGIYAIPGVSLLFFLGYWFTEGMVNFINQEVKEVKPFIIAAALLLGGAYLFWYMHRKIEPPELAKTPPTEEPPASPPAPASSPTSSADSPS